MARVDVAQPYVYNVLRELGARSQPSFAALREGATPAGELVVLARFVRSELPSATGPGVVNDRAFAKILRNANAALATFHPNLARVRHVDVDEDTLSVASEMVDGATLRDLATAAEIPLEVHVRILLDVLSGLSALHATRDGAGSVNLFHGELCPANVVVGKDGVARIVGLFRPIPVRVRAGSEALAYASPEALDIDGARQPRCDLYAVGVMLWEAVAQRELHHAAEDPAHILAMQRSADVPRPDDPEDPPRMRQLAEVAMKALAFDPNLRFRSPNEMAQALRAAADGAIASGSAVATHVTTVAGEAIRTRRSTFDPLSSGSHKKISGVRRSVDLEDGGMVMLVPDVVTEEVAEAQVRIADSSLMPPSPPSSRSSGASQLRFPSPTVEADIMSEMLALHGAAKGTDPGATETVVVREEGPSHAAKPWLRPFPKPPLPTIPDSIPRGVPTLDFPTIVAAERIPGPTPVPVPPSTAPRAFHAAAPPTPSGIVPVMHAMQGQAPFSMPPQTLAPAASPRKTATTLIIVAVILAILSIIVGGGLVARAMFQARERSAASMEAKPTPAPPPVDQKVVAPPSDR